MVKFIIGFLRASVVTTEVITHPIVPGCFPESPVIRRYALEGGLVPLILNRISTRLTSFLPQDLSHYFPKFVHIPTFAQHLSLLNTSPVVYLCMTLNILLQQFRTSRQPSNLSPLLRVFFRCAHNQLPCPNYLILTRWK